MQVELKTLAEIETIDPKLYDQIIENNRYIETEYYEWWDITLDYFQEQILDPQGLEGSDLTFSLYYPVDADLQYEITDIKKFLDANLTRQEYNYLLGRCIELERIHNRSYIINYHPLIYQDYSRDELKEHAREGLEEVLMLLFENKIDYTDPEYYQLMIDENQEYEMQKIREEINRELLTMLEAAYEDLTSDETIREILIENNYLFDKTGSTVEPF